MKMIEKMNFNLDSKFNYLEKITVKDTVDGKEDWFNQTLCKVNSSVMRIGVFNGELEMHTHEDDDELFFVLEGNVVIESENGNFELSTHEGVCIPKGVKHRPTAKERSIVLMVENESNDPRGDKA